MIDIGQCASLYLLDSFPLWVWFCIYTTAAADLWTTFMVGSTESPHETSELESQHIHRQLSQWPSVSDTQSIVGFHSLVPLLAWPPADHELTLRGGGTTSMSWVLMAAALVVVFLVKGTLPSENLFQISNSGAYTSALFAVLCKLLLLCKCVTIFYDFLMTKKCFVKR